MEREASSRETGALRLWEARNIITTRKRRAATFAPSSSFLDGDPGCALAVKLAADYAVYVAGRRTLRSSVNMIGTKGSSESE